MVIKKYLIISIWLLSILCFANDNGNIISISNAGRWDSYKGIKSNEGFISKTTLSYLNAPNKIPLQLSNNTYKFDIKNISVNTHIYIYLDGLEKNYLVYNIDSIHESLSRNDKLEKILNESYFRNFGVNKTPNKVTVFPKNDGLIPIQLNYQEYSTEGYEFYKLSLNKSILIFCSENYDIKKEFIIESCGNLDFSPYRNLVLIDHFPSYNYFFKKEYSSISDLREDVKYITLLNLDTNEKAKISKNKLESQVLDYYAVWGEKTLKNTNYEWISKDIFNVTYTINNLDHTYQYDLKTNKSTKISTDEKVISSNAPFKNDSLILKETISKVNYENFNIFIDMLFEEQLSYRKQNGYSNIRFPQQAIYRETFENSHDVTFNATSNLSEGSTIYDADNLSTYYSLPWVEGEKDSGVGEKITIKSTQDISYLLISNGYNEKELFEKNNRVKRLKLKYNDTSVEVLLQDTFFLQEIPILEYGIKDVELEILDVYEGTNWNDTCISFIGVK